MIARIATQFHLPPEYTETQSGWPYHSAETPNGLGTRSCQSRKTVECIALIETDT
jgi:hypothetical protein